MTSAVPPEVSSAASSGVGGAATHRFQNAVEWSAVLLLGAMQAVAYRFYMNPDGVSYLNLSDWYASGDWSGATSTYWSPLYPWLLGQLWRIHRWSPYWESSVVHAVNLLICLASYACFRYMLGQLRDFQEEREQSSPGSLVVNLRRLPESIMAIVLFLWASLILIGVYAVTPDMLVAVEVYLVAGIMVRALRGPGGWAQPIILGMVLGLAYLTKAVMFPIGFMVIALVGWGKGPARWSALKRASCLVSFLVTAAPQLISVSHLVGHASFGESGKLAYARYVNLYPEIWVGLPANSGHPIHPPRKILTDPEGYEFPTITAHSSYPFWDAPAWWQQGIRPHFNLTLQKAAVKREAYEMLSIFLIPLFAWMVLYLMAAERRPSALATVCVLAFGVFLLYSLVYSEPRYVAPWGVVLFLCAICSLRFSPDGSARQGVRAVLITLAIIQGALLVDDFNTRANDVLRILKGGGQPHQNWIVASSLRSLGLRKGDRVASVGRSFASYWARLAGAPIAMEIPESGATRYWTLSASERDSVNRIFADRGAKFIVASVVPDGAPLGGWIPLGSSSDYALPLRATTRY